MAIFWVAYRFPGYFSLLRISPKTNLKRVLGFPKHGEERKGSKLWEAKPTLSEIPPLHSLYFYGKWRAKCMGSAYWNSYNIQIFSGGKTYHDLFSMEWLS